MSEGKEDGEGSEDHKNFAPSLLQIQTPNPIPAVKRAGTKNTTRAT